MVLEEHAMLSITSMVGSKNAFERFLDIASDVNKYLVDHDSDFKKACFEVEANEELNSEV